MKSLSRVWLFATPRTVAYQAPQSMEFSRQGCWSGLPFPSPRDLPNAGIEPRSPALQADALPSEPPGKPHVQIKTSRQLFPGPSFLIRIRYSALTLLTLSALQCVSIQINDGFRQTSLIISSNVVFQTLASLACFLILLMINTIFYRLWHQNAFCVYLQF